MRYQDIATEGVKDWLGSKWSELTDPALKASKASRQAIESDVAHNYNLLTNVAMRYTDHNGTMITPRTFEKTPMRAVNTFLRGIMKLNDRDIEWVMGRMGLPNLSAKIDSDKALDSFFNTPMRQFDTSIATKFLQSLARYATVRLYEKNRMKAAVQPDDATTPTQPSKSQTASSTASSGTKPTAWSYGDPINLGGKIITKDNKKYKSIAYAYSNALDVANIPHGTDMP